MVISFFFSSLAYSSFLLCSSIGSISSMPPSSPESSSYFYLGAYSDAGLSEIVDFYCFNSKWSFIESTPFTAS